MPPNSGVNSGAATMRLKTDDVLPPGYRLHWYQLQSLLGDGGFGITYLGRDTNLNQAVAIKEYFPKSLVRRGDDQHVVADNDTDPEVFRWGLRRFLEEAKLLARFRHTNIVRVLSVFEALGTAFIVMELERGMSLADATKSQALTTEDQVLDLVMPLLDGLDLVHESGFIHRDIKPCNILLRPNLGPVLIDFGSARQPLPGHSSELTAIVSRGYAPFEQYDAGTGQRQGPWTDVYGLAATLYHVVTGGPCADALTRGMCLLNGDPDPFIPATECAPGRFSNTLLKAVDRGLAFKSEERPQSVAAWRRMFPDHGRWNPVEHLDVRTVALDVGDETEAVRERLLQSKEPEPSFDDSAADTVVQVEATATDSAPEDAGYLSRRMLLVDDERAAQTLTQRMLSNLGVTQVDAVASAEEALERVIDVRTAPEVLLCDLELPGLDGVQFLRLLAERSIKTPLLLLADGDERLLGAASHLATCHGLRVLGALRKPVRPDALARALSNLDTIPRGVHSETDVDGRHLGDDTLRDGIAEGIPELVYLPKVSLKDRDLLGVEALVRWPGVSLDVEDLVHQVEALGLADALTELVLRKALAASGRWRAGGIHCGISVNVFAASLNRLDLPEHVIQAAAEEGVTPRDITLEVNEMRFQARSNASLEVLSRLRLHGVELAIDDFGTGTSTLERLRRVPFSEIKVDRTFVASAAEDRTSRAILESSVALARRIGIRVVAEGVSDERTWDLVTKLGFDAAQGYFVSPPLKDVALADWSRDWCMGRRPRLQRELAASA